MALFKVFKGNDIRKLNDPSAEGYMPPVDGYAYYNTDNQEFYIDADYDGNGVISRKPINAFYAYSAGYDGAQNPQKIDTTYIKDISFDNDALTITKGNNTTASVALDIPYASSTTQGGSAIISEAIPFGIVDSTSTSTVFTATVPGITELKDGTCVLLKNGVVTSASGFTININNLGAKKAYSNMAAATAETTLFNINYTMLFIYDSTRVDGGGWIMYRGYNSNDNTIGYQLRTNSTTRKTTDTCRYYKIFFSSVDGTHWVPASVNSTNNATAVRAVNQRPIDPFGPIVYTSASASYAAEANVAATTIWQQYNITLGYSFNRTGAALTLTTGAPVYIKCAPQADGSAIIDADTPYVQVLPGAEDGKIYIFLGNATSATQVELTIKHPVYYFKNGAIRLWTNQDTTANQLSHTLTFGANSQFVFDGSQDVTVPVYTGVYSFS